jgi:predicted metal-dependent phosphoesterase TrpH
MSAAGEYLPVDLHMHSSASDGSLSPADLIAKAAGAGLAAAALTDHDTLEGVDEALAAGERCGLEVLPGIELSSVKDEQEIHLLGYDPIFPDKIEKALKELRRDRYRRMSRMVSVLRKIGFDLNDADVAAEAKHAAPGRLHLARLMVKKGFVPDINSAFSLYLRRGRPAFVPRAALDPAGAIKLLHRAGAVPVLAHPGSKARGLLRPLVAAGLRGIEVIHPDHSPELVRYYRHQAQRMDLLITGGSDYHGDGSGRAGQLGSFTVPYRCLVALKKAPRGLT